MRTFFARSPCPRFQLFNSGRYDINAMQIDFFSHLTERNLVKYAVRRNNTVMAVKIEKLKFLDIANYLAAGFSYS